MSNVNSGGERGAEAAQFQHDCERCQYLGRSADKTCDLYTCEQGGLGRTFLARYGNEGSEYLSMPAFLRGGSPQCMEAQSRFAALSGGRT